MEFTRSCQLNKGLHTQTKLLIEDVNHALTFAQRKAAIGAVNLEFGHAIESAHDYEVEAGAASALCLQLGYAMHRDVDAAGCELVGDICRTLSLVYRCSDAVRDASFRVIGTELLPLLMKSVDLHMKQKTIKHNDETVVSVMILMHLFSRVDSARIEMVKCRGLLRLLVEAINGDTCEEAKTESVAALRNISYYSEDYRLTMVKFPGLLHSLVQRCYYSDNDRTREYAASTIRNLSANTNTKLHIAEHGTIINGLMKLSVDENPKTRRSAMSAIVSLATAAENRGLLTNHCDGALIDVLLRTIRGDSDNVVRRRAARALRCLGRGAETTGFNPRHHHFLDTISTVAVRDASIDVRVEASHALMSWVSDMVPSMPGFDVCLEALVHVSLSKTIPCVELAIRTLRQYAEQRDNHVRMVLHSGVLQTLSMALSRDSSSLDARENAAAAILNLAKSRENCEKSLTGKYLLDTLVKVLSSPGLSDSVACRDYVAETIVLLSSIPTNRKRIARQEGLVAALVQYTFSTLNNTNKKAVKKTIMDLVPEM